MTRLAGCWAMRLRVNSKPSTCRMCRCRCAGTFRTSGYYILGDRFETNREVRIVADAGPLGYLSIAAHGHADALSFTLSVGGKEILIDPGTYAYHTQRVWRDYFKGTSAHNTVRIDGVDQSVSGGNFLWVKHAQSQVIAIERTPLADRWVASHDGYARLKHPLTIAGRLLFEKQQSRLQVTDELLGSGEHEVETVLAFRRAMRGPGHWPRRACVLRRCAAVDDDAGGVALQCASRRRTAAARGWISRSFDAKAANHHAGREAAGSTALARLITRFNLDFTH